MKRICVFAGSSSGVRSAYLTAARALGELLAAEGIEIVYGGGKIGLMGEMARAALQAEGRVVGVIPSGLKERELAFRDLPDLRVVDSMHERKALMAELSDGFIALPGGLGTIEEFFEALTWAQLGIHGKPCGLLNVEGYYDELMEFLSHMLEEGFVEPENKSMLLIDDTPAGLLKKMREYRAPETDKAKWVLGLEEMRHGGHSG